MSDQHRGGAWGTSAENAVWWPGAISADQSNLHHQQILNQHHQQNHMQQQQQQQIHQVVVQQQQQQQTQALNDVARSNSTTSVASQQLFSYKMASSFPSGGVPTSSASAYDYRLAGMGQGMATTNPSTQWWYTTAGQNALENLQQQQQHQQQQQIQQQQQQNQQQSQSQHQTQNIHNVHSNTTPVSSLSFQILSHSPLFSRLFTYLCTFVFLLLFYYTHIFCHRNEKRTSYYIFIYKERKNFQKKNILTLHFTPLSLTLSVLLALFPIKQHTT